MKKAFYIIISLSLFACTGKNDSNSELKPEIDFTAELEKSMEDYQPIYETKVASFAQELDSIKSLVRTIEFDQVVKVDDPLPTDIESNFVVLSIHAYNTVGTINVEPFDYVNDVFSIVRRGTFEDFMTPIEDRFDLFKRYYGDSSDVYDDEHRLSVFNSSIKFVEEKMTAKYVIVIKDFVMMEPKLKYPTEYNPGEVLSGVFLYNREKHQIEDQFIITADNEKDVDIDQNGDLLEEIEKAEKELMQRLKSIYDKKLVEKITNRYSLKENPTIFF